MENEITVKVLWDFDFLVNFLNKNNFKLQEETKMDDIYYIKEEENLNNNFLDILNRAIIIRKVEEKKYLVIKNKIYDSKYNILSQTKTKLSITNIEEGKEFLKKLKYKELLCIHQDMFIYKKEDIELCIQKVNNKYLYIEFEQTPTYNTIDKLKKALESTKISYDKNDYFIKKAEIIFREQKN